MDTNSGETMLITGGSGFISLHCIAQALAAGYQVRTTVRSATKQASVLKGVGNAQPPVDVSKLSFVNADLMKDEGWDEAVKGVSLVLHVASPFPGGEPKDENEIIRPAVDGTLRVLKAAKSSGTVKRVVVTSSNAAVSYGRKVKKSGELYTEEDWTKTDGEPISTYLKSKTLAERAAWNFMEQGGGDMELVTVCPVGVFGPPLLLPNESTTCGLIQQLLQGKIPAMPKVSFGVVDVRDVASLHLLVATRPEAKGQRYLCVAGETLSMAEIAAMLRKGLGDRASKVPKREIPDVIIRLLAHVMPTLGSVTSELGERKEISNAKAKALGWNPRSNEEAIVSCGQALIDAGVCK